MAAPNPTRPLDRVLLALGVLLVAATVVVALTAGGGASEEQAAAPAAGGDTVTIKGFRYMPKDLTVKAGTSVTFVNDDTAAHTASANESGAFDTGGIDRGAKKSVTFDKPGTYAYICEFHPIMKGTLTVRCCYRRHPRCDGTPRATRSVYSAPR